MDGELRVSGIDANSIDKTASRESGWGRGPPHWVVRHDRIVFASVYIALAILLAIPMLATTVPLGADDLNHLARIYVRAHIETDQDLSRIFVLRDEWTPYLGTDVLLTPLARIFPILVVGRVYTVILVFGLVAAVAFVRWAFTSRVGLVPAVAGLFAYNGLMAWGLIIYMLGVVLALILFAMWHMLRDRPWGLRLVVFTVGSTLLYFTHVVAFFCYGLLVASYEVLGRNKPWRTPPRDWFVLLGQAVPALVLWENIAGHMTLLGSGEIWGYNPAAKMIAIFFPFVFRGAAGGLELGVVTAVICEYIIWVGILRGWLKLSRRLLAPALVMVALTAIAPFVFFGEHMFDLHFPIFAVCLLAAGVQLTPKASMFTLPIAALIGLLTASQMADVSILTHKCDMQYAEARDAFATLPRGAKIVTVINKYNESTGHACTTVPIFEHMAQLVTIDRSGYSTTFFARATSVAPRGNVAADERPASPETFVAPADGFVFWVHWGQSKPSPAGLTLVRRGSFFDIWATDRAEPASQVSDLPVLR